MRSVQRAMNRIILVGAGLGLLGCGGSAGRGSDTLATAAATLAAPAAVPYGHNEAAGKTFTHDGVTLYYEV